MGVCWHLLGKPGILGIVGIAVIGAFFHNCGQLGSVYLLMGSNEHLLYQLPVMALASVVFGVIVGSLTPAVINAAENAGKTDPAAEPALTLPPDAPRGHIALSLIILALCMALSVISNKVVLMSAAVGMTVFVQILEHGSLRALFYPLQRFWMFFLFIGVLDCFFTYGTRVAYLPGITREGLEATVVQWLRLWTWLQSAFVFRKFLMHAAAFKGMQKLFPGKRSTLFAGLLALECFPPVVEAIRARAKPLLKQFVRHPATALQDIFRCVVEGIAQR
jgi:hypothetical protein